MHVLQFLVLLLVAVHVEIVKPRLPELWQVRDELRKPQRKLPLRSRASFPPHLSRDALLEHLQHCRRRALLWLADQQMHMIWHHHVTHQKESILSPNSAQFLDEQVSCSRCPEQRQPPVATERQKMKMTLPVVALQSLWHSTPKPPPSKTEGGAPPVTLLPDELQKWYSLIACRRQEKGKKRASGPPVLHTAPGASRVCPDEPYAASPAETPPLDPLNPSLFNTFPLHSNDTQQMN